MKSTMKYAGIAFQIDVIREKKELVHWGSFDLYLVSILRLFPLKEYTRMGFLEIKKRRPSILCLKLKGDGVLLLISSKLSHSDKKNFLRLSLKNISRSADIFEA